jgi:hypothetical protein
MRIKKKVQIFGIVVFLMIMATFTFISRYINESGLTAVRICQVGIDGSISSEGVVNCGDASYIFFPLYEDTILGRQLYAHMEKVTITAEKNGTAYIDSDSGVFLYIIPEEKKIDELYDGEMLREV